MSPFLFIMISTNKKVLHFKIDSTILNDEEEQEDIVREKIEISMSAIKMQEILDSLPPNAMDASIIIDNAENNRFHMKIVYFIDEPCSKQEFIDKNCEYENSIKRMI